MIMITVLTNDKADCTVVGQRDSIALCDELPTTVNNNNNMSHMTRMDIHPCTMLQLTRGQSNLTKSASRGGLFPG